MKIFSLTKHGDVTSVEMGYAPVGRPMMTGRLYMVDGILIDSGLKHCRKEVKALVGENPRSAVYLTHHHEDHSGNAAMIRKQFQIPILGHPITVEKMAASFPIYPYQHYMWGASQAVEMISLPEIVETEHYRFHPIHTPGHSRDHVVYWEPDQGWLFSGDLYLADRIKYYRADETIKDQIASLSRVLALDFDTLFCAHNPKLVQAKKHLARKLDFLQNLVGQVAQLWQKGLTCKQMMKEMGIRESYPLMIMCGGNVKAEYMVRSALDMIKADASSSTKG